MDECKRLNYKEHQIQAVFDDLSSRLKVDKKRVIQRWHKIKDLRDQRKSVSGSCSASSSSTSAASKQQEQPTKTVGVGLEAMDVPKLLELLGKRKCSFLLYLHGLQV